MADVDDNVDSDTVDDVDNDDGNDNGDDDAPKEPVKPPKVKPTPLIVKYMNSNEATAKIVKLLMKSYSTYQTESEAPPVQDEPDDPDDTRTTEEIQQAEDAKVYSLGQLSQFKDDQGRNLFQWAVERDNFLLVELLLRFDLRCTGLLGSGKPEIEEQLEIFEKWKEERTRIEDELIEKLKSDEEDDENADKDEEDEDKEPEPDFSTTLASDLNIPVQRVNKVGDLGVYLGTYSEEGLKHGLGVTLYPNGDLYIGRYEHGRKNGKGAYVYKVKDKKKNVTDCFYAGEWEDNDKCGSGYMLFPNGNRYIGQWANNKMHGNGKVTYLNGDFYIGEFKNGVKCGKGEYNFYKDRSKYVGLFDENGNLCEGVWECNSFVYKGPFSEQGVPGQRGNSRVGTLEFNQIQQRGIFDDKHLFHTVGDVQDLVKQQQQQ